MKKLLLLGLMLVGFQARAESCEATEFEYTYGTAVTVTSGFYKGIYSSIIGHTCITTKEGQVRAYYLALDAPVSKSMLSNTFKKRQ